MKGKPLGSDCRRRSRRIGVGAVAAVVAIGATSESAAAEELRVTNTAEQGRGSFAAATRLANSDGDRDVISFRRSMRGRIQIDGDFEIKSRVVISGRGYGNPSSPAFGRVRLQGPHDGSDLIFDGIGNARGPHPKAAVRGMYLDRVSVLTQLSRVDIARSYITGDGTVPGVGFKATYGYDEPAQIERSTITGWGQGVAVDHASARIDASLISDNEGVGGVFASHGHIRITESLISGNTGPIGGVVGGYYGGISVANSTITGNVAEGEFGGDIKLGGGVSGNAEVNESTITANRGERGGGIGNYGYAVEVTNSIVAGNESMDPSAGDDCTPYLDSGGGNLIGSAGSCQLDRRDLTDVDPRLTPLGDHGGPTLTYGLRPESPAVGLALRKTATRMDQRGVLRDDDPDSGAFELK